MNRGPFPADSAATLAPEIQAEYHVMTTPRTGPADPIRCAQCRELRDGLRETMEQGIGFLEIMEVAALHAHYGHPHAPLRTPFYP